MSDIKFSNSNEVVVEAFTLKVNSADLQMDFASRRKNNTPHRRAIVHDFNDGLTINWAEDYPGGVTINGEVKITKISGSGGLLIKHTEILLDNSARRGTLNLNKPRRAFVHDSGDGLTLNWDRDYPGGVTINGDVKCPHNLIVQNKDVLNLINTMEAKIVALESRIAILESKIP